METGAWEQQQQLQRTLLPCCLLSILFPLLQRLRTRYLTSPVQFELLFSIIDEEVGRNDHDHGKSCTKGLLWLKRYFLKEARKQGSGVSSSL
jgi:hypothetical protein